MPAEHQSSTVATHLLHLGCLDASMNTSSPSSNNDPWNELLNLLTRDESILDQTVETLRATVPGYESVPTAALEASARRNIELSIRTIRAGKQPRPEDVDEADALAAERHAQGVPIGSMLAGFRVCMSVILDRLVHQAPLAGIPADQVLASSILLWSLGDAFSSRAGVVYQDKELSRMLADSARRTEWISSAVITRMDSAELIRGAALYRVPTAEPLRAVVVDSTSDDARHQLHHWADLAGVRLLSAARGGTLVGIMIGQQAPDVEPGRLTVGIGHPVTLESLPESFEAASLTLKGAQRVGGTGIANLESLSWRLAVHTTPATTAMLRERYIEPLQDAGTFGEHVLEAVEAYMRRRLSIPAAASSIPVHVNTLRYRLQRFSVLTGADLADVDTLIEVSWALAARAGDGRSETRRS